MMQTNIDTYYVCPSDFFIMSIYRVFICTEALFFVFACKVSFSSFLLYSVWCILLRTISYNFIYTFIVILSVFFFLRVLFVSVLAYLFISGSKCSFFAFFLTIRLRHYPWILSCLYQRCL